MKDRLKRIRFGILCDTNYLALWERETIDKLLRMPNSSLELLIRVDTSRSKIDLNNNVLGHEFYKTYVKWLYKPSTLRRVPIADLIEKVYSLTCVTEKQADCSHHLNDADVNFVRENQLDFILNFSKQPIGGPMLSACRLGVWVFRYGRMQHGQDLPAGFWEIYNHDLVTVASLCQLSDLREYVTLKEGVFRTKPHNHSGLVDSIHRECLNWPSDVSSQFVEEGSIIANQAPRSLNDYDCLWPSNKQVLLFLMHLLKRKTQNIYKTLFLADQWNIGVVNRPIQDFLHFEDLEGVNVDAPSLPNRNVFYADCFARREDSGTVVYFELYDYRVRRGNISQLNYPWQVGSMPTKAIGFPFHLSYPFLFGSYCIPEAWVTNSVRLYDISQPVTDPAEGLVLLPDVPGIDATLLVYENRYWLFYTRADRDAMMNLFISYADSLEGPWREHSQNPVKSDIRSSRPAGPFFESEGKLYRPSQDCALDYGCGITVNEVVELTTSSYVENTVSYLTSLHPDYPNGMHTITAIDDTHTLIDFKRYRFIPMATASAVWMLISPYIIGRKSFKSVRIRAEVLLKTIGGK